MSSLFIQGGHFKVDKCWYEDQHETNEACQWLGTSWRCKSRSNRKSRRLCHWGHHGLQSSLSWVNLKQAVRHRQEELWYCPLCQQQQKWGCRRMRLIFQWLGGMYASTSFNPTSKWWCGCRESKPSSLIPEAYAHEYAKLLPDPEAWRTQWVHAP